MSTLSVLSFPSPEGADAALQILKDLEKQELVAIEDAAIVTWPVGKKHPKTRHGAALVGLGALDGSFWGFLFGLLFFAPFVGALIGAAIGALTAGLSNYGIDKDFIEKVRGQVTEGTSALFLLTDAAVPDRIIPRLQALHPHLITTNLPAPAEAKLREMFHTL